MGSGLLRRDSNRIISLLLNHYFSKKVQAGLSYQWTVFDSNGNYADYGPGQWATSDDTVADNSIIEDYYSYTEHRAGAEFSIYTSRESTLGISIYAGLAGYPGRLAKNINSSILFPEEKREDSFFSFMVSWTKEQLVKTPAGDISLIIKYSFNSLKSNDAYFRYSGHAL